MVYGYTIQNSWSGTDRFKKIDVSSVPLLSEKIHFPTPQNWSFFLWCPGAWGGKNLRMAPIFVAKNLASGKSQPLNKSNHQLGVRGKTRIANGKSCRISEFLRMNQQDSTDFSLHIKWFRPMHIVRVRKLKKPFETTNRFNSFKSANGEWVRGMHENRMLWSCEC